MGFRATIDEVCAATGAALERGDGTVCVHGVATDTRSLERGSMFLALQGPRFDGNRFARAAIEAGAAAVLVREGTEVDLGPEPGAAVVLLHPDPLAALAALAAWHRSRLGCQVLGITGSSGKTSTKGIAQALLGGLLRTVASPKSFNNAIGVPLSILAADETTELLVLEIGTNAPGEIAALCRIARPTCGIVTNVGPAHLEGLGSLEGVAREKGDLPASLPADGFLVVNAGCRFANELKKRTTARAITFGVESDAELDARELLHHTSGTSFRLVVQDEAPRDVTLPLLGQHNVQNLLAVLAAARGLGLDIDQVLAGVSRLGPEHQRLERHELGGVCVLDDTYNSNPDSARAAVRVLAGFHGFRRRVLVLGDMLELGDLAAELHFAVGVEAARSGLERVVAVGELARAAAAGALEGGLPPQRVVHVEDVPTLLGRLGELVQEGDVVLVKGSRGLAMEQVVEALVARFGASRAGGQD